MGSQRTTTRTTAVTVHSSGSAPSALYKKARPPIDTNFFLEDILEEGEKLVAHPGTSQYSIGGVSTCGLASLNFARLLFDKEHEGVSGAELLEDIGSVQSVEDTVSISSQWPNDLHLEVENIASAPIFDRSMKMVRCIYGKPTFRRFLEMLRYLESASRNTCVAVITRPPEIITCAKIPTPDQNIFVIFDTHPRPEHPDGSGITYLSTSKKTAQRLSEILSLDKDLLAESDLQWQVQLLANFSAHIFVPNDKWDTDHDNLTQTLLGSSLTILALQAQLSDLTSSVREAKQATSRLEKENVGLQETVERLRERLRTETRRPPPQTTQRPNPGRTGWPWPPWQLQQASTNNASTSKAAREQDDSKSLEFAFSIQREYDEENRRLERERLALHATAQAVFDCSICLDTFPMDDAARVPECRHVTCRDCLRQHVLTTLHDHRFPVFCPLCTDGKRRSVLSQSLIHDIGMSEQDYHIWEELQLSAFSILMHCRQCQNGTFVDRTEYQESKIITCPLPGCSYTWCKSCSQAVDTAPGAPEHSCDGTSELNHLMKERGWHYCPGCKTPVQKDGGCNHMTCTSPGCNSHFCYVCGNMIVQSALRDEISNAISEHYRNCTLFEVPPE
ncbi:hypothetical protein EDD18DRAFT_1128361 [Armillaria luteobubalina]|uniref:RBR-type E3 ubiquitin transferase n=1 Tax=Armillaria luteobubalina TaxID=153913 RepID=A0AA39QMX0_9AGAR|nr:hypothetical protein EDD18DRAFT_1128361 [Armillaria luteobubalina]